MTKIDKVTDWLSKDKPNIVLIGTHNGTSEYFQSLKNVFSEKIAKHTHPVNCVTTSFAPHNLTSENQKKMHKGDLDSLLAKARVQKENFLIVLVGEDAPTETERAMFQTERLLRYHKADEMKLLITMDPKFVGKQIFEDKHKHLASVIGLYEEPAGLSEFAIQLTSMTKSAYSNHVRVEMFGGDMNQQIPSAGVVQNPSKK